MNLAKTARKIKRGETVIRPWYTPLAVVLLLLVLGSVAGFIFLNLSVCRDYSPLNLYRLEGFIGPASGLAFGAVGLIVLYRRPANRIGWLCSLGGLGMALGADLETYINCALAGRIAPPGLALTAWFFYAILPLLTLLPIFVFLPLWFPNGRFLTPHWRRFAMVTVVLVFILSLGEAVTPDFRPENSVGYSLPLDNPLGLGWLPSWWGTFFGLALNALMIFGSLATVASMILRMKRAVGDERQQMRLFAYWTVPAIIQLLVFELLLASLAPLLEGTVWYDLILFAYNLILILVFLGFPLIIGIAIFKYRLYDIDLIINRTLLYGGLSLGIVAVYVLVVGGLGALFQSEGSFVFALLATGLIAVLFQPLRERLQRGVNRLMFGERDDPYAVLSQLSHRLQETAVPAETVQAIVDTLAKTLKLPYAAIELVEGREEIGRASVGTAVGASVELPLRYQNEIVGRLSVSPRAPGESFTAKERQLLNDIAGQAGPVAHSVRLNLALQRSRERLVLAREEERRRIRRDLHDGLGPTLASQTFKLDAALDLLDQDPGKAADLLHGLKTQTQDTVADIRRLVHALRPPALDELGLVGALRAHTSQIGRTNGGPQITIRSTPARLPQLPAAIEVAAYRIALEGLTNVVRHARAHQCTVHLSTLEASDPCLQVVVDDDGVGMPDPYHVGIGLTSIRERAEELGGSCTVARRAAGGTRVLALLPLPRKAPAP
jgi:signal transduction histidine kinase